MSLITTLIERPLDGGYQEAADRRTAAGMPPATSTRTVRFVALLVVTGFVFAVAAQSLRPSPGAAAAVKGELVARIEQVQEQRKADEARLQVLGEEVSRYESLALSQAGGSDLSASIRQLEVAAGTVAVAGPGLLLSVDDAESVNRAGSAGGRPSGTFESGRVTSADLQIVVNGLWAAGAEAISINGQRLTTTAAIRFAGQAIIVDFRPLARPYIISVVGDPDRVQQLFEPSFAGVYLSQLTDEFGIRSALSASDAVAVPAGPRPRLVSASPLTPSGTASSSPGGSPSGIPSRSVPAPTGGGTP